jgi:hypothetical protein
MAARTTAGLTPAYCAISSMFIHTAASFAMDRSDVSPECAPVSRCRHGTKGEGFKLTMVAWMNCEERACCGGLRDNSRLEHPRPGLAGRRDNPEPCLPRGDVATFE